jgi:hypothetical protein
MGTDDRFLFLKRCIAVPAVAMLIAVACTTRSSFQPALTPPGGSERCFGRSDFGALPPVVGALVAPEGADSKVGGRIALPKSLPEYATRLSSGLVSSSIGGGHQAFVIDFHSSSANAPLGTIIYADRAICTLTPTGPDETFDVQGHAVYVLTSSLDHLDTYINGTVVIGGVYVDISLAWAAHSAPTKQARIDYLRDWVERIVS